MPGPKTVVLFAKDDQAIKTNVVAIDLTGDILGVILMGIEFSSPL
jgi:hypothetical protein